ncbi:MAG: flagellin [Ilumatobacteraceae bacterium]
MRINQNIMAANASRNLTSTNGMMSKNLEKLSSGLRINRAADDAAGMVVSTGLRAQVSGLRQASRNAQDGISVVQTAEGALNEVHTMLNRMRDLTVQAANTGGNDTAARTAAQAEISQLTTEITRVSSSTKFGGTSLLNGTFGVTAANKTGFLTSNSVTLASGNTFTININGAGAVTVAFTALAAGSTGAQAATVISGAINTALAASAITANRALAGQVTMNSTIEGSGVALTLNVGGLTAGQTFTVADGTVGALASFGFTVGSTTTAAAGSGGTFQVGANSGDTIGLAIGNVSATALGVATVDVTTDAGAAAALTALDAAIASVSSSRGTLGAVQNRFESMINNLSVTTENLMASESRIRDLDMASEMVSFTKNQVLQQAGTAMLSQANQIPQSILSLLRG